MRNSVFGPLLLVLLLLSACNADKGLSTNAAPDSLYTEVAGNYEGSVSCPACATNYLWYNLQLKKDGSFMLKKQQNQSTPASKSIMGSWTMTSDSLIFLPTDSVSVDTFFYDGNMLRLKFGEGNAYKASGTDFLKPVIRRTGSANAETITSSNADFIAENDGWSLRIDFEDKITFIDSLKNIVFSAPATYGTIPSDLKAIIYRASLNKTDLVVTVFDTPCTRSVPDSNLTASVSIVLNTSGVVEEYRGCGKYLPDERLKGEWILQSINGEIVDSTDFMKGSPKISFTISEGKVSGNDGCNSFFGPIIQKGNILIFGEIGGTLMNCPDMEKSATILKILSNQRVNYSFTNKELILTGPQADKLVYKRLK